MAITKQQLDKDKELLLKSALPIGTLLQSKSRKYYVVEVLGGGGFGITYKVYANEMIGNISQKIFFVIKEYFIKGCFYLIVSFRDIFSILFRIVNKIFLI